MKTALMKFMVNIGRSFYNLKDLKQFEYFLKSLKNEQYIFTSFQLPESPLTLDDMIQAVKIANRYDKILIPDINESLLDHETILSLHQAGLTHLRLDVFVSLDVLETLTQYFMPVVNASTYTNKEHSLLTQYISSERIIACHNYYPKRYTGLSYERLCQINTTLKHLGVKIATFLPGEYYQRGPLYEGLPTVEKHRHQRTDVSFLELVAAQSDIIFVSEEEVSQAYQKKLEQLSDRTIALRIDTINDKLYQTFENRTDYSEYVYRCQNTRGMTLLDNIALDSAEFYPIGTVVQSNDHYLRYAGEIEIVLEPIPVDIRYNVVGKICIEDVPLLKYCHQYRLKLVKREITEH